ncbi:uncharacterized protein LOC110234415 [Exaiptasia diaphana]|uniref:Uncharacterized protein n=1 Tax=Exaiptasia diaphana TaxID=2652724 RepID=A0A913WX26_EXADI|nr:uncharacterized protein LOC110234415 [Exaiptasia diaphana]
MTRHKMSAPPSERKNSHGKIDKSKEKKSVLPVLKPFKSKQHVKQPQSPSEHPSKQQSEITFSEGTYVNNKSKHELILKYTEGKAHTRNHQKLSMAVPVTLPHLGLGSDKHQTQQADDHSKDMKAKHSDQLPHLMNQQNLLKSSTASKQAQNLNLSDFGKPGVRKGQSSILISSDEHGSKVRRDANGYKLPMSAASASKAYGDRLTTFEQSEIVDYDDENGS